MKKLFLISALAILTGCPGGPSKTIDPGKLNIYQPSILKLEGGKAVQTHDGIYTPQTNEVWHSDKRYRELERNIYFPNLQPK